MPPCVESKRGVTTASSPSRVSSPTNTTNNKRPRRSTRGSAAVRELAELIVKENKKVVIVTGAGLSVASGVRPFRSFQGRFKADPKQHGVLPTAGLWNDVIWTTATRQAFRKDPVRWYNEFWIPHFLDGKHFANMGHYALQEILEEFTNVTQITQNIDGIQPPSERLIEAHGRIGLYKCLGPPKATDTDSTWNDESSDDDDTDDDEERPVHLGHRRKARQYVLRAKAPAGGGACPFQYLKSLDSSQLEPISVRTILEKSRATGRVAEPLEQAPTCPSCGTAVLPQALLFDEGYHSHAFYQFERIERLLEQADVLVFCGTSFSVRLTLTALNVAKERQLPVYNFNLHDCLAPTQRLNAINIVGPAAETLPHLMATCRQVKEELRQRPSRSCTRKRMRIPM